MSKFEWATAFISGLLLFVAVVLYVYWDSERDKRIEAENDLLHCAESMDAIAESGGIESDLAQAVRDYYGIEGESWHGEAFRIELPDSGR